MIEIEKKFLLSADQQVALLVDAEELGERLVTDSYLDTKDYRLTTHDLWFRERNGEYELKMPLASGSGVATNRYHELTDLVEISQAIQSDSNVEFEVSLRDNGIAPFMTCYTQRKSYKKRGFHIDVDTVTYKGSTFEYAIAEIELLVEGEQDADDAETKIIEFAKEYDLVTDQIILGKVAAFLKSDAVDHYDALVAAGVLK